MLTCIIERASDWSGIGDIPVPGAYCCGQWLIPRYETNYPFSRGKHIGERVARKWAIQVEHLEDLVDLCESYSGDNVVIDKYGDPRYDYHVTIYDDYILFKDDDSVSYLTAKDYTTRYRWLVDEYQRQKAEKDKKHERKEISPETETGEHSEGVC